MLNPASIHSLLNKIKSLKQNTQGVSAVEFAIIAPVMISAYLGGVEVSNAIAFNRKVTLAARALSDLVAQSQVITPTDVTNIMNAANQVLYPYNTAPVKMVVSSIKIDKDGVPSVVWSEKNAHGTAHYTSGQHNDADRLIPATLRIANSSLAVSEVTYSYTPNFFNAVIPSVALSEITIMRPRLVEIVCKEGQTSSQCSL